jgi:Tol biopolymer transport system component
MKLSSLLGCLLAALLVTGCSQSTDTPQVVADEIVYTILDSNDRMRSYSVAETGGIPTSIGEFLITSRPVAGSMMIARRSATGWTHELASTAGTSLRTYAEHDGEPLAAVAPDGATVFYATAEGAATHYTRARADGSNAVLVSTKGAKEGSVAFRRDGSAVAFYESGSGGSDDLMIVGRSGATASVVTSQAESLDDYVGGVAFSAPGDRLYYTARDPDTDTYMLKSIRTDGTDDRTLVSSLHAASMPVVSPDGATIAFIGQREERVEGVDIYLVGASGSGMRAVTAVQDQQIVAIYPEWSRDGSRLLVQLRDQMIRPDDRGTLHVLDVATGSLTRVPGTHASIVRAYWK